MKTKLLLILTILAISPILAQAIEPKVVTTIVPEAEPTTLDQIQRFYEISEKSLQLGVNVTLDQPTAFKTTINSNSHYIIATDFTENSTNIIFMGKNKNTIQQRLNPGDYIIFKIEELNLQFTLKETSSNQAKIELKLFEEQIPANVSYFELFDIQVRLPEHTIYSSNDLTAIVEFTNFGEGPSHTRLIYSIANSTEELYTSIDQKIVQTDEVVIKKFSNLNLPNGKYTLTTTIYYGQNQEATSQDTFEIKPIPKTTLLTQPLIFIAIILACFTAVFYVKKKKSDQDQQT